jgi:CubicO group peptidase (beta-lactamase class C family)
VTVPSLGEALKQRLPKRVFAPGTTGAYSNYAVGLAGYIVERVSGMPFEDYIEGKVFAPFMSKGYAKASADPERYEFVTLAPAGSAAVSAADMAKFMIAHLDLGAGLMQPATAQLMHDPAHVAVPGVDRMALGFGISPHQLRH